MRSPSLRRIIGTRWLRSGLVMPAKTCMSRSLPVITSTRDGGWWKSRASRVAWWQIGSQSRSLPSMIRAVQLLNEGVIGKVYLAKACASKRRKSIGKTPEEPAPPGLDWSEFLGQRLCVPTTRIVFAYNWHWFWDTGNGRYRQPGNSSNGHCRWSEVMHASDRSKYALNTTIQETPGCRYRRCCIPKPVPVVRKTILGVGTHRRWAQELAPSSPGGAGSSVSCRSISAA